MYIIVLFKKISYRIVYVCQVSAELHHSQALFTTTLAKTAAITFSKCIMF